MFFDYTTPSVGTALHADDATPAALADRLAAGLQVSAQTQAITKKDGPTVRKFLRTDVVFVSIPLTQLTYELVMATPFTRDYCTVAAFVQGRVLGEMVLAFQTPEMITKADEMVRLMEGLQLIYPGARDHACAEQCYGLPAAGRAEVIGNRLDKRAKWLLNLLGGEGKQLKRSNGAAIRSKFTLSSDVLVRNETGEEVPLESLKSGDAVACPVHLDRSNVATVVVMEDGSHAVCCPKCKRTYTTRRARNSYDFTNFDRTIRALWSEDAAQLPAAGKRADITYAEQRFLQPFKVEEDGLLMVKSPKGTGKTAFLEQLVKHFRKLHKRVLVIGHRRNLLSETARRLRVDCYFLTDYSQDAMTVAMQPGAGLHADTFEEGDEDGSPKASSKDTAANVRYMYVAPSSSYAVCLDSLPTLKPKKDKYDVIIIDESEQVFAHLLGSTLKDNRRLVYLLLKHYLGKASNIVALDADMGMVTMRSMFELVPSNTPVQILVNEPRIARGIVNMYNTRGRVVALMVDAVLAGKKIFVATNSKKKAADLELAIKAVAPGARTRLVTADNAQSADVQRFLQKLPERYEHEVDALIASPALGTGVDISFRDEDGGPRQVVGAVFGFFEANIVTHFDIDQHLMRVREPGEVHVWVSEQPMDYETDVACILEELRKATRDTNQILGFKDDGTPEYDKAAGLSRIWAEVLAAGRGSKNDLARQFELLRRHDGWEVVRHADDEASNERGKEMLQRAKERRRQQYIAGLLAAEVIGWEQAADLAEREKLGLELTQDQQDELERYRITRFYDRELTEELLNFDNEGRTRGCIDRLERLLCNRNWLTGLDAQDETRHLQIDRRHNLLQRSLLEDAFVAAGLFDTDQRTFKQDVMVESGQLAEFVKVVKEQAAQFEHVFGTPMRADLEYKPMLQLQAMLGLVGLSVDVREVSQSGGKKTRRYALNWTTYEALAKVVRTRDEVLKREVLQEFAPSNDERWTCRIDKKAPLGAGLRDYIARKKANN